MRSFNVPPTGVDPRPAVQVDPELPSDALDASQPIRLASLGPDVVDLSGDGAVMLDATVESSSGLAPPRPVAPPGKNKAFVLPDAIDVSALETALDAHPVFRAHMTSRFRATAQALRTLENPTPRVGELIRVADGIVGALEAGEHAVVAQGIDRLFGSGLGSADMETVDGLAEYQLQRTLASVVTDLYRDGRSTPASVGVRYAEHVRAYHAANGNPGQGPDDPDFWANIRNGGLDTLFRIPMLAPSVYASLEQHTNAPEGLRTEFNRRAQRLESPHEVVQLAAEMAGRHAHATEGLVCQHAAEITRELLAARGFDATVRSIIEPFGHAYVEVEVEGTTMFVDGYFDPRGVLYQSLASVRSSGFRTPGESDAPRY